MDNKYSIYYNDREVGHAQVKRVGLYCFVECACILGAGKIYVLYAQGGGEALRLGVPIPCGNNLVLKTRIPAKRFPDTISRMYLLEKGVEREATKNSMEEGKPVAGLADIMESKLKFSGDAVMLVSRRR